jgi:hypothetical protein
MPHSLGTLRLLALTCGLCGLLAVSISADAAGPPQRTFVHSDPIGNDANPCTLASPCRTFGRAISVVNGGGEVVILDTAGYGPFTINKSVKIIGPSGVYGGISVQGGASGITTGIVINAADTDVVTLRGLDISGVPGAAPLPLIGIDIQNAGTVNIERTSIANFTQGATTSACINVVSARAIKVFINDSFLRECAAGISAQGTGPDNTSRISLVVDNTRIQDSLDTVVPGETGAMVVSDAVIASVRNSVLSGEGGAGGDGIYANNVNVNVFTRVHVIDSQLSRFGYAAIETDGAPGASVHVNVSNSHFNNNNAALLHRHGQVILISNVIGNNNFSLVDCGGGAPSVTSLSYGSGNGSNTIVNNTDVGPFPAGCSGLITPTQFAGK